MGSLGLSQELIEAGKRLLPELITIRRKLHEYPELSMQERETSALVAAYLQRLGLDVRTGVGGFGVVADIVGAQPGPLVALRADMDALPIQEETGLPYASRISGVMHACGHDAHTAILLGAASILVERSDRISGTVRLLFQSAEEINAGAKAMVDKGVLEGVTAIYGLHNQPTLPTGQVATREGPMMGSVDRIELMIEGKGGHGAIPDQSIDPIVAAAMIISSLQTLVSREISPFSPVVITFGSIHAGEANNVIPQRVELTGTVRTFSIDEQVKLQERIERMVNGIAIAYRCHAKLRYIEQVPVLVNEYHCLKKVEKAIDWLLGQGVRTEAAPTLAGEDFSVYLNHVRGCFFWLGSGPQEGAEQAHGLHHPGFRIEEDTLGTGASLLSAIILCE